MNAILTNVRALLAFVTQRTVMVELNPDTEKVEAMVKAYFEGVNHIKDALKAFLTAKQLWQDLHGG